MVKFKKAFNAGVVCAIIAALLIITGPGYGFSYPDPKNMLRLPIGVNDTYLRVNSEYLELIAKENLNFLGSMQKKWVSDAVNTADPHLRTLETVLYFYFTSKTQQIKNYLEKKDVTTALEALAEALTYFKNEVNYKEVVDTNGSVGAFIEDLIGKPYYSDITRARIDDMKKKLSSDKIQDSLNSHIDDFKGVLSSVFSNLKREVDVIGKSESVLRRELNIKNVRINSAELKLHKFINFKNIVNSYKSLLNPNLKNQSDEKLILVNGVFDKIGKLNISEELYLYQNKDYLERLVAGIKDFIKEMDNIDPLLHELEDKQSLQNIGERWNTIKEQTVAFVELFSIDSSDLTEIFNEFKDKVKKISDKGGEYGKYINRCTWELSKEPLIFERRDKSDSEIMVFTMDELITNADNAGKHKQDISVKAWKEKRFNKFMVSDNGPGISEKDLPHIFEEFYTTKPSGEKGGKGLYIIKTSIVDLKGGSIKVISKTEDDIGRILIVDSEGMRIEEDPTLKDTGTTFIISIPEFLIEDMSGLEAVRPQTDI